MIGNYLGDAKVSETRLTIFIDQNIPLRRSDSVSASSKPHNCSHRIDTTVYDAQGVEVL